MAEEILRTEIPREKGYLYYVKTSEDGKLIMCKAKMARGGKKKKETEKIE